MNAWNDGAIKERVPVEYSESGLSTDLKIYSNNALIPSASFLRSFTPYTV